MNGPCWAHILLLSWGVHCIRPAQMDSVSLPMKILFTVLYISHGDLISGTHSFSHLQRTTVLICGGRLWLQSLMMSQARRNHLQTPGNESCYIDHLFFFNNTWSLNPFTPSPLNHHSLFSRSHPNNSKELPPLPFLTLSGHSFLPPYTWASAPSKIALSTSLMPC